MKHKTGLDIWVFSLSRICPIKLSVYVQLNSPLQLPTLWQWSSICCIQLRGEFQSVRPPLEEGIICSCINLDLHYLYCWLKPTLTGRDGLGPGTIWVAVMPHRFLGPLPCPITIPHLPTITYAMYGW